MLSKSRFLERIWHCAEVCDPGAAFDLGDRHGQLDGPCISKQQRVLLNLCTEFYQ